jgi:hypothetical protein
MRRETREQWVERKLEEKFDKKYPDFESFRKDVYEKIDAALKDVEEGRCKPAEECFKEMEEKYGIQRMEKPVLKKSNHTYKLSK